jgi:hypothetical protein
MRALRMLLPLLLAMTGTQGAPVPDLARFVEAALRRASAAGPELAAAVAAAQPLLPRIAAASSPSRVEGAANPWLSPHSFGPSLADYARNSAGDGLHFETFSEAARRIVDQGQTCKRTPDGTSRWLDAQAARIEAALAGLGTAPARPAVAAAAADLRVIALFARFHSRRQITAVHYNLFRRQLKLTELVAATFQERDTLKVWTELVEAAAAGPEPGRDEVPSRRDLLPHWREELRRLTWNVKDLEDQCCPPDESLKLDDIWQPARDHQRAPLTVEHVAPATAPAGQPLLVAARISDPARVQYVRLRFRRGAATTQFALLEMSAGPDGRHQAAVPASFVLGGEELSYFLEVMDKTGNGMHWPDLDQGTPHHTVRIQP